MAKKPTEQGVSPRSGTRPPKEKQFGQPNGNPRNPGGWKKEDTPRYKLERMMQLGEDDLTVIEQDITAPKFERNLAKAVRTDDWNTVARIINQVYGKPKESVDLQHSGDVVFTNSVPRPKE
jgi:hypothetical protein